MKTIATVLLVLVAIIGMAGPVLGAEAGSSAGAYADWDIAQQYSSAWAQEDDAVVYAETQGAAEGDTYSESFAAAGDDWGNDWAYADTYGESSGWTAYSGSYVNAETWDSGWTETGASSYAAGDYAEADSGSYAYWGPPIYSESWADGYGEDYGYAESGCWSYAEE